MPLPAHRHLLLSSAPFPWLSPPSHWLIYWQGAPLRALQGFNGPVNARGPGLIDPLCSAGCPQYMSIFVIVKRVRYGVQDQV